MLTPSDPDYLETRQILLVEKKVKLEFQSLGFWIEMTYEVKPLNIW